MTAIMAKGRRVFCQDNVDEDGDEHITYAPGYSTRRKNEHRHCPCRGAISRSIVLRRLVQDKISSNPVLKNCKWMPKTMYSERSLLEGLPSSQRCGRNIVTDVS